MLVIPRIPVSKAIFVFNIASMGISAIFSLSFYGKKLFEQKIKSEFQRRSVEQASLKINDDMKLKRNLSKERPIPGVDFIDSPWINVGNGRIFIFTQAYYEYTRLRNIKILIPALGDIYHQAQHKKLECFFASQRNDTENIQYNGVDGRLEIIQYISSCRDTWGHCVAHTLEAFFITCQVSVSTAEKLYPVGVRVRFKDNLGSTNQDLQKYIPVKTVYLEKKYEMTLLRYPAKRVFNFTVCTQPIHTEFNDQWLKVLLFIETYRHWGADHFVIYNTSANREVDRVLEYYESRGLLEVVQWPDVWASFPANESFQDLKAQRDFEKANLMLARNDCIQRSSYLSRFLALVDFDEFIWTKTAEDGTTHENELLNYFATIHDTQSSIYGGYQLRTAFCNVQLASDPKDFHSIKSSDFNFSLFHRIPRQRIWPTGMNSKYVVRPEAVAVFGTSGPLKYKQLFMELRIPASRALLYHLSPERAQGTMDTRPFTDDASFVLPQIMNVIGTLREMYPLPQEKKGWIW